MFDYKELLGVLSHFKKLSSKKGGNIINSCNGEIEYFI